jgi:hypothetical protein
VDGDGRADDHFRYLVDLHPIPPIMRGRRARIEWRCMVEARMAAQAAGKGECDVWTAAAREGGPAHREWSLVGLSVRGALSGANTLPHL